MKNKIIIAIIAAALGFGGAYLLFANKTITSPDVDAGHEHEMTDTKATGDEIWTCSMHPQIRQNEPGDCPLCGMDLIPLEEGGADNPLVLEMTADAAKLANIQTTIIGAGNQNASGKTIQLNGTIKADERRSASQVTHIPGRIEQLYVTFTGETVTKGQRLASIYSPELVTAQKELLEAIKFQSVNPKLVEAARQKLKYWKIGDATIQQIEESGKTIEVMDILADASGVVTNRKIAVGDYVKEGQALFDLMNLSKVWVLFDAYEEDLAFIKKGNLVEFTTPAIPDKNFRTRITFIDPILNAQTRTTALRAELNNSNGLLKPEMFVKGIIKTASKKSSKQSQLTVPKTAVLWTGKRSVVYVKVPDQMIPSFEFRELSLGESIDHNYLVQSGLEAGEEVVTNGAFTIDAAAQLNNQKSMMNRQVNVKGAIAPPAPDFQADASIAFKTQLQDLAKAYIQIKDALVETDASSTQASAKSFGESLKQVDMMQVKGEAHEYWMQQLKGLEAHTNNMFTSTDVEEQRRQFDFLSQLMIQTIQAFGVEGEVLYVQHCPMAFENEGADWLSYDNKVLNPYFGDKMLTCGVVKDSIR